MSAGFILEMEMNSFILTLRLKPSVCWELELQRLHSGGRSEPERLQTPLLDHVVLSSEATELEERWCPGPIYTRERRAEKL